MSDGIEELKAWQQAAKKQLQFLREENEKLNDRVAELEQLVAPDPEALEYDALSTSQKIQRLRQVLLQQAVQSGGTHALKYGEVMTLFNNNPSAGHCYDLMKRAGNLDGFDYTTNRGGTKVIRVKSDAVNDESLIHFVNKATSGEGP